MDGFVHYTAAKRGMGEALQAVMASDSAIYAEAYAKLVGALDALARRGGRRRRDPPRRARRGRPARARSDLDDPRQREPRGAGRAGARPAHGRPALRPVATPCGRLMTDPVHVVNGDSVEHTLAHTGLPGAVVVWRDVLHEGDVPPGDPAAVREARAAFLAGAGYGSGERILADSRRGRRGAGRRARRGSRDRAVVRARPARPAPADPDPLPHRRASGTRRAPPDHARQLPGAPGLRRAR